MKQYRIVEATYNQSINGVKENILRQWDNLSDAELDFKCGANLKLPICLNGYDNTIAWTRAYDLEYAKIKD